MIKISLLTFVGLALRASAACTRAMLQSATTAYIKAQTVGQLSGLPLANDVNYLENDVILDIKKGVLSQPIVIDLNRTLLDTTECASFVELTAARSPHPYVIHTRMVFTEEKISTLQSVVSDDGDWLFNATAHLRWNSIESWDPIPADKRDSREVLKAAGDAYLDSWTNGTVKVPYGTPCQRLEGGLYTGDKNLTTNTCTMPLFPEFFTITNRRYVIDEEVGGIDIFNNFPFIDTTTPDRTPSTNFFRVEGGKIRYIHEVTVCSARNCGR
jgi:hypothetical protein